MNAAEYNIVRDFIQETLGNMHIEDFVFDPMYMSHPKQSFPDLAYGIAGRLATRFDFIDWDMLDHEGYWIWKLIMAELNNIEAEENWTEESWLESPIS